MRLCKVFVFVIALAAGHRGRHLRRRAPRTLILWYGSRRLSRTEGALSGDAAVLSRDAAAGRKNRRNAGGDARHMRSTSLALISSPEKRAEARAESEQYFASGRRDKATLGDRARYLGSENGFSLFFLGSFCLKTLPAASAAEAQAEFLTGFMRGYSKTGV